ncbi:hypothetical protein LCGC14_1351030, partial [marine sediment metagenome]
MVVHSPEKMPLAVLARRLTLEPPSIEHLIGFIGQSEVFAIFLELVREYVPDHEREIMRGPVWERAESFRRRFEQEYFPLADFAYGDGESLEYMVHAIPVELMGWEYDQYHEYESYRPGATLLLGLVINPFDYGYEDSEAARVPILDSCTDLVGAELVARIPARGWDPEALRTACGDKAYGGVADFAEWLCAATGLWMLDCTYEMYGEEYWDRGIVDELTKQWPLVKQRLDRVFQMYDWLETSPVKNFTKVLDFLVPKLTAVGPKVP